MKIVQKKVPYSFKSKVFSDFFTNNSIFVDIETTGFSPKTASIYLIGCITRDEFSLNFTLLFAEAPSEQYNILKEFQILSNSFSKIVTYNGDHFDLPFLKQKFSEFNIPCSLDQLTSLDLMKELAPLKTILKLDNIKQQTLEEFLHFSRDFKQTGRNLIKLYRKYLQNTDSSILSKLLEHNFDDLLGMVQILSLLSYNYALKDYLFHFKEASLYVHENSKQLILSFDLDEAVPQPISYQKNDYYVTLENKRFLLSSSIQNNYLFLRYDDYKNYYYLPTEDMALHKSVATYVDKSHRIPATKESCYSKFPIDDSFLSDSTRCTEYTIHTLKYIIS